MSFLLHVSVKVINVDISGNSFSGDNYAVLWLHNADWDKYQTSRPVVNSPPVELFIHNITELVVEIKDTRPLLKDKSYGKVTIELFDSHGKLRYPELTECTVNEKLKGKVRTKGKIELVLLLHVVYSAPQHKIDRSQIHYPFRNLVLEGGGVRGIAYGGCLEILESKGILANLVRICGTSAGAIAALLLSLGANAGRIKLALEKLDFASFKDGNIISNFGLSLHSGKVLSETIKHLIEEMLFEARITVDMLNQLNLPPIQSLSDITFAHLSVLHQGNPSHFRLYYAIGTKLQPNLKNPEQVFEMVVFSAEKYPQIPLWEATRISMGLPFYFKPITIDGIPYVDGGVLYNYAINVFDNGDVANPETLGIRVDKPDEIAKFIDQKLECHSQGKLFRQKYGYLPSFDELSDWITTNIQNSLSIYQTTKTDDGRSVYINTGSIGTTDFDIKKNHRDGLMQYGRAWCESFFSWWDDAYLKNPRPTGPLEEAGKLKTMANPNPSNMNNMNVNPNPNMQNLYPNPDPQFCPNNLCPQAIPNFQPMSAVPNPNMGNPQGNLKFNPNVCPNHFHA